MSGQQKKSEQLKQQLLNQIQTQQEGIEALSDEELESVAGGMMANINTGVAMPSDYSSTLYEGSMLSSNKIYIISSRP